MGMAASQARLLSITARIHDVEYQAQSIQNAKVQLATQSDQVYNEYLEALDATTLTVLTLDEAGNKTPITANFNNLFSRNRVQAATSNEYALINKNGKLVVEDEIETGYYAFKDKMPSGNAYEFAMFMINGNSIGNLGDDLTENLNLAEEDVYNKQGYTNQRLQNLRKSLEEIVGEGSDIYHPEELDEDTQKQYDSALNAYRKELYNSYAANICDTASHGMTPVDEFDTNLFNYFMSIFNQIENCGGCVSIADFNGNLNGDAANNSDWLQAMVQSGQMTISIVNNDKKTGETSLEGTSPSADSCLNYTETTSIDKKALAKAEAKYEHDLKAIDKKDKAFDMDLSKLETQRTALTTEYDSVKKVIQDNIDRTFGIFS